MSKRVKPSPSGRARSAGAPATVKRSITLDRSVDEAAHALVGNRGFSELVNDAVRRTVQRRLIEQDVLEYEAEHGRISKEHREHARAQVEKYLTRKR